MSKRGVIIRAFDGSLADAQGLLAVERATFNESPYSAEQVRVMLSDGPQRTWLAVAEDEVVGFVAAFPTGGLQGSSWEIDLLAVHPTWTGRGLATRLIRAAASGGAGLARRARAVVATDNRASTRAFTRTGFRAKPGSYKLLIYRPQGLSPRPWSVPGVTVREAASMVEAMHWLAGLPPGQDQHGFSLLLAEKDGRPAGYAELIEVQTLLYRGLWIESLVAPSRTAYEALVCQAVNGARAANLDEIGAMVPDSDGLLQQTLLAGGFRSLGDFQWFTAELPLPGSGAGHV